MMTIVLPLSAGRMVMFVSFFKVLNSFELLPRQVSCFSQVCMFKDVIYRYSIRIFGCLSQILDP